MERTYEYLLRLLAFLAMTSACIAAAHASIVERSLMPGEVIRAHAKWENECKSCHVSFDRAGQTARCVACHEDVAADLKAHQGMHGRLDDITCNACHTDHKGRDAKIIVFDAKAFRHQNTDFQLQGAHATVDCIQCHVGGRKYREAPATCFACHQADDRHKGEFGKACDECHAATDWKTVRFDHQRTGFALRGKHAQIECEACHVEPSTRKALDDHCNSCHKKDDPHRGSLGNDCASCHEDRDWKHTHFDHRSTGFALIGKHLSAECNACHKTVGVYTGLAHDCVSCHRSDDRHEGTLGGNCAKCHDASAWKPAPRFDHAKTRFTLDGGHRSVACLDCHSAPTRYHDTDRECVACHRKDDTHKGRNGDSCADCHAATDWKQSRFEHDRDTSFKLLGKHREAKCDACHATGIVHGNTVRDCVECHRKDDPHKGKLGSACSECHAEDSWTTIRFDHDKARFTLMGAHRATKCDACHQDKDYRGTPSECAACHAKDDAHKTRLGANCADCHSTRAWSLWDFDHQRRTRFALSGAHAQVACTKCHSTAGVRDLHLAQDCGSCHAHDDPHDGQFGNQCDRCHQVTSFHDLLKPANEGRQ